MHALPLEELVLELDPVQTQGVQRALEQVHTHQHKDRRTHEHEEAEEQSQHGATLEAWNETVVEEHFRQLRVGKRQSPKTQVGGSVRNGTKHELDRLNQLVNHHLAELMAVVLLRTSALNNVRLNVVLLRKRVNSLRTRLQLAHLNLFKVVIVSVLSLVTVVRTVVMSFPATGQEAEDRLHKEHGRNRDTHNSEQSQFDFGLLLPSGEKG